MPDIKKLVAIGDSITYGFPYTPVSSWVHLASKNLGIPIINKGMNGDTSYQMLERFDHDVIRLSPSHVIIMGGTNDACARIEAEEVFNNFCSMVEKAMKNEIKPILGLPIPCNYIQDEYILSLYREDIRDYAAANTLPILDFYKAFLQSNSKQPQGEFYADVLHPNERGYKVMAEVAIEVLQNINE